MTRWSSKLNDILIFINFILEISNVVDFFYAKIQRSAAITSMVKIGIFLIKEIVRILDKYCAYVEYIPVY